ncbi:MAG: GNAT family N-acetyltransferase [Pseudomonadota bacterium]
MPPPTLTTARLLLRPFSLEDAPEVQRLAGDARVADTTQNIPHPYPDGAAEAWIHSHTQAFRRNQQAVFAITLEETSDLAGAVGLTRLEDHTEAELGYWVGVPFWNRGIATEATLAVLEYGFTTLGLTRIVGWYLNRNPASGRVMLKAGMTPSPATRSLKNEDVVEHLASRVLTAEDWQRNDQRGPRNTGALGRNRS